MSLPPEWMPCLKVMGLLTVEISLVAAAAAILERQTRSVLWRRTLWQAAVAGMFLLFIAEVSGLSRDLATLAWNFSGRPAERAGGATANATSKTTPLPADVPPGMGRLRARSAEQLAINRGASHGGLEHAVDQRPGQAFYVQGGIEPFLQGRLMPWPALIWAIGVGAALCPVCIAWFYFALFHRRGRVVRDEALLGRVGLLAGQLGVNRPVRLFQSARLHGPIAYGLLRPTIGLPLDFAKNFSTPHQDAMLAHELAHLAAHDSAWQKLGDVTAALLWWHPLAWWSRRALRAAAERAADEASLLVGDGPGLLAECLVKLASEAGENRSIGFMQATGRGSRSELGKRIHSLINLERRSWSPLSRARACAVKVIVPTALVAGATLCTAWIKPPEQGEAMNIKQTWNRTLATLTLFAALNADPASAAANEVQPQDDGRTAPPSAVPRPPAEQPAPVEPAPPPDGYRMDPRLMERYGLRPGSVGSTRGGGLVPPNRGRQQVEAKLNQIIIEEVKFDELPLPEVITQLQDEARAQDPAKQGLNFIISNVPGNSSTGIDPTTGMPLPATFTDISSASVKLHLRDVRMKDVLDAITRVADEPIEYSIEDYGVVFSPGAGQSTAFAVPAPVRTSEPPRLFVRTFRIDTNTFAAGLESAFNIRLRAAANDPTQGRQIQAALRDLLTQLGSAMDGPQKAVFYNAHTGIIMVRATAEDLELAQAAIETLGGRAFRPGVEGDAPAGRYGTGMRYGEHLESLTVPTERR